MKTVDRIRDEIEGLRERLSKFVETGVRINESLEFDTVRQSVLDSASVLVHARYAVIAPHDDEGDGSGFPLIWNGR